MKTFVQQMTAIGGTWGPLCGNQICFAVTKLGYVNGRPLLHAGDLNHV